MSQPTPIPATGRRGAPEVTVVVITWEAAHLLAPCLDSLRGQTVAHRVIVVDNASTDGTARLVRDRYPEVRLEALERNTGFAGGVAHALPLVETRFLALLNNDAVADPDWLSTSVAMLRADDAAAAVGARMVLAEDPGTLNNAGVLLLRSGYGADRGLGQRADAPAYDRPAEVFAASGGAVVYRTLAVKAVGGIDPDYFLYYEDTDLGWRLRLHGWSAWYCPDALVVHRHAASSDPTSELFAFQNERNRLLTLYRNAPVWFAALATFRFLLTTASLTAKRLLRRGVPSAAVFDPPLRLRALREALRRLPSALRVRRATRAADRRAVLDTWRGTDSRPVVG